MGLGGVAAGLGRGLVCCLPSTGPRLVGRACAPYSFFCFFFQAEDGIRDIGVTGVQTCALPICNGHSFLSLAGPEPAALPSADHPGPKESAKNRRRSCCLRNLPCPCPQRYYCLNLCRSPRRVTLLGPDRKSTRLNSSHANISYAVFCLKKKKHSYHTLSPYSS